MEQREEPAIVRIGQVTTDWLEARLGGRVHTFATNKIGEGEGFLGSIHRITIEDGNGGGADGKYVRTVVAKLAPIDDEESEMFLHFFKPMGVFVREASFYREVGPLLEQFCATSNFAYERSAPDSPSTIVHTFLPRCYVADIDEESGCGIMLLEDLRARGLTSRSSSSTSSTTTPSTPSSLVVNGAKAALDLPRLRLALRAVAALHALYFAPLTVGRSAEPERAPPPFPFLLLGDEPVFVELVTRFYTESIRKFRALFGDLLPAPLWERCEAVVPSISAQPPVVAHKTTSSNAVALCHGDLWRANLMYYATDDGGEGARGEQVALLDWQFVSWGNPLSDVAFLVYSSLDADVRRANEEALLRYYHEQLMDFVSKRDAGAADGGHGAYTFERCYEDFHRVKRATLVQTISSLEAFLDNDPQAEDRQQARKPRPGPAILRLVEMVKDLATDGVL